MSRRPTAGTGPSMPWNSRCSIFGTIARTSAKKSSAVSSSARSLMIEVARFRASGNNDSDPKRAGSRARPTSGLKTRNVVNNWASLSISSPPSLSGNCRKAESASAVRRSLTRCSDCSRSPCTRINSARSPPTVIRRPLPDVRLNLKSSSRTNTRRSSRVVRRAQKPRWYSSGAFSELYRVTFALTSTATAPVESPLKRTRS
jgi:hypothetical protein